MLASVTYTSQFFSLSDTVKDKDALSERVASLVARCDAACEQLEKGRAESEKLVLEQFDEHLKKCAIAPERLPCNVRIRLQSYIVL